MYIYLFEYIIPKEYFLHKVSEIHVYECFQMLFLISFPIAKFYNSLWIKLFSNLFQDNWVNKIQSSFQQCSEFINQISHPFFQADTKFIYALCLYCVIFFFHPFTTTEYWKLFVLPCLCFQIRLHYILVNIFDSDSMPSFI